MKTKRLFTVAIATVMCASLFADGYPLSNYLVNGPRGDSLNAATVTLSVSDLAAKSGGGTTYDHYILDKRLYIAPGQELIIEPGVIVKAEFQSTTSLVNAIIACKGVKRGATTVPSGKLTAVGTADEPIIFTTTEDPVDGSYPITEKEKWGGIILLGNAFNNVLEGDDNPEVPGTLLGYGDGIGYIEGLPYPNEWHHYGAIDTTAAGDPVFVNDDNSGHLEYVCIRHGGYDIGEANEINGLTCGSVGSSTILRHIEITSNGDDGVEFFGGTADIKYLSVMFCQDDYLDADQGWTGRAQFILGVMLPVTVGDKIVQWGDNGFELDGDDGPRYGTTLSEPTVFNATIIGPGKFADIGDDELGNSTGGDKGIEMKERIMGLYANSIFAGFNKAVNMTTDAGRMFMKDSLKVKGNMFLNCGAYSIKEPITGYTKQQVLDKLASEGNFLYDGDDVIDDLLAVSVTSGSPFDDSEIENRFNAVPQSVSQITQTLASLPESWFDENDADTYRGAFKPDFTPWTDVWSYHEDIGSSFVDCPADVDGDGTIGVNDFNAFAVKYGKTCDEAY